MSTITWSRPSGTTLTTNDSIDTVKHLKGLGWTVEGEKPKRTRRTKEQIEADKDE